MASGSAFWSVILPVEKTNYAENPSYEKGTAGASAIQGATLGSTATFQQFGAWALTVDPTSNGTSGAILGTFQGTVNFDYTASAYVRGQSGINYMIAVTDTSNAIQGSALFTGGGTWHRYNCSYSEGASATRRVIVRKNADADTSTYYVDGWQIEQGSLTTYLDGDADGCQWLGSSHAAVSFRSGQVRAGGSVVRLADLGLIVTESFGIGMPPLINTALSNALLDGAQFQRQRADARTFTLVTTLPGTSWGDFHVTRRDAIDAFKIDAVTPQQPARFWYTGANGTMQIDAVLTSGLEFNSRAGFTEDGAPLQFTAYDPYWEAPTQQGKVLTSRVSLGSVNYIAWCDRLGKWGTMGANGSTVQNSLASATRIQTILPVAGGSVLIGGIFGTVAGTVYPAIAQYVQSTNRFGTLIGGTLSDSGGVNVTQVFSLLQLPSGSVIIGGRFGTAAGTQAKALAQWNGAFGTLVGGTISTNGTANALVYSAGTMFIGGGFTLIGGTATQNAGFWTGAAFGTLTNGTAFGQVYALAVGLDLRLHLAGAFSAIGGTTCTGYGFWRNGTFGTTPGGFTLGNALATGPDGQVYVGGLTANINGTAANGIIKTNNVAFTPLGLGVDESTPSGVPYVYAIYANQRNGEIVAGGQFDIAGSIAITDGLALWNGASWRGADIDLAAGLAGSVYAIAQSVDGTTYIGGDFTGTAYSASLTVVANAGRSLAYPTLRIRNPSSGTARLYQMVNQTTGAGLHFNLLLQAGEDATLVLTPGARSFQSSYRGNVFGAILPGSNLAQWALLPGTNYISFFADNDSLRNDLFWNPQSASADGGTTF